MSLFSGLDPLTTGLTLLNTLGQYLNAAQMQQLQQNVYGQQETALNFAQTPRLMNQYVTALQDPYSYQTIMNQQLTPNAQGQTPAQQMGTLENQYMQGLNSALTSNVWNQVQGQLAQQGQTQAPGVAAYDYSQALAPYYEQNLGLAAQQAQFPFSYGLNAAQLGIGEAQFGLGYPLQVGSGLAGLFPNYNMAAGGTIP
jgi:hypothetical protein